MSDIAEFAQNLHLSESKIYNRELIPLDYPSECNKLTDIRAVICDVYGTLINYWKPDFDTSESRTGALLKSFNRIIERFGMAKVLEEINPGEEVSKTLSDFYHGLISLQHEKAAQRGIEYPEVKIEDIWNVIIMILKRRGYKPELFIPGSDTDYSRILAFSYNFYSLGRQLFPGVANALDALKQKNIMLGILSNAQFYTPIDLTLLIRGDCKKYDDFNELFDPDLTFFSYEYGVAKPNQILFRRLFDALYEFQILPSQTVFVGNDLMLDIKPAKEVGMKTAFYTGDQESAFVHDLAGTVIPDITFQNWEELPEMISFHSEENKC